MSPAELKEIAALASKAGELLQQIQRRSDRQPIPEAAVRFPRGYLRTADSQRARLPFVQDNDLKSNLAYTLILSDVVTWVLLRTDLAGTAQEMMIKLLIFLVGTMVESVTKDYLHGICGKSFKERNKYLCECGIISADLQTELDWLWEIRNNMHLFLLEEKEYVNDYTHASRKRAIKAFRDLLSTLEAKGRLDG